MDTARGFSEDRSRPSLPVLGGIVFVNPFTAGNQEFIDRAMAEARTP